jgi:hypothetical protein
LKGVKKRERRFNAGMCLPPVCKPHACYQTEKLRGQCHLSSIYVHRGTVVQGVSGGNFRRYPYCGQLAINRTIISSPHQPSFSGQHSPSKWVRLIGTDDRNTRLFSHSKVRKICQLSDGIFPPIVVHQCPNPKPYVVVLFPTTVSPGATLSIISLFRAIVS